MAPRFSQASHSGFYHGSNGSSMGGRRPGEESSFTMITMSRVQIGLSKYIHPGTVLCRIQHISIYNHLHTLHVQIISNCGRPGSRSSQFWTVAAVIHATDVLASFICRMAWRQMYQWPRLVPQRGVSHSFMGCKLWSNINYKLNIAQCTGPLYIMMLDPNLSPVVHFQDTIHINFPAENTVAFPMVSACRWPGADLQSRLRRKLLRRDERAGRAVGLGTERLRSAGLGGRGGDDGMTVLMGMRSGPMAKVLVSCIDHGLPYDIIWRNMSVCFSY